MPILPTNFVPGSTRSGGLLDIPASAGSALPPWLVDAVTALQMNAWPTASASPTSPAGPLMPAAPARSRASSTRDAGIQNRETSTVALGPRVRGDERADASGTSDIFTQTRGAIPQGLADNADALLAFAGGTLRGGLGLGASEAAKIGSHAAQLAQHRQALAAQQAAALAALQARGIPDAAALAMMNPALARVLLTRGPER